VPLVGSYKSLLSESMCINFLMVGVIFSSLLLSGTTRVDLCGVSMLVRGGGTVQASWCLKSYVSVSASPSLVM
jgi:hypothetical protein